MMKSGEHKIATADAGNGQYPVEDVESSEPLELEVERLQEELAAERERGLRALAEFDNYRRRVRRESASAEEAGKRDIILALLDVMDDFDRALAHVSDAPDAVADGLRLIHQRLSRVLDSNGVTPFQSAGEQFDPTVHEAISVVESDGHESDTVYEEERRGYLWNGELLRPARVIVVR
ncbi:MAG TPA: nucleotide exchange factor GrpE [Pyrinomonadaceae bacterium]